MQGNLLTPQQAPTVETCRSMPQHTENWVGIFGGKISDKISIPSLSTHLSEVGNTLVVKCCIYDWEINSSIVQTPSVKCQNGKLYHTLCAVWLSSKGAILKDHVLGKNKKQPDGHPLNGSALFIFAGCRQMHSFVFGSGFCHLFSFWKICPPPPLRLEACHSTAKLSHEVLVSAPQ